MKFEMEFRAEGRKVSAREFGKRFEKGVVEEAEKGIRRLIESTVCPFHGKRPASIRLMSRGSTSQWEWEACCEKLNAAVARKLGV
jgi:hypothetical protein